MPTLIIKGANGTSFTVECDKHLQQQILSPDKVHSPLIIVS